MTAVRVLRRFRDLKDVTFGTPADGDAVVYHAASDELVLAAAASGGGAPSGPAGGVLSGTYPNPGFAQDMATQTELNSVNAALGNYQPLDSDLTAIAALTTTTFGRSLLALVDAAAGRTSLGIAAAVGGVEWTVVTKTADESVASNTTVQNDDELFFTAVSGAAYEIDVLLIYGSPAGAGTPDIKVGYGEDGTARGDFVISGAIGIADIASTLQGGVADTTAVHTFGTAAANRIARVQGSYVGNGGTFRVLWAQNTSGVNATIVRAGSLLRYRRIA